MTRTEFIWLCCLHNVDPSIALEDERVKEILKTNKDSTIQHLALSQHLLINF
jgi:hypothetical protein